MLYVLNSTTKSTPSWFARKPSIPAKNGKQEKEEEEDNKDGRQSNVEGSSESEVDRLVTKREKSSDEDETKQVGQKGDRTETSDEVRVHLWLLSNR